MFLLFGGDNLQMCNEKKKLCIFTLYEKNGASSYYRIIQYIDELEKVYSVSYFPFWGESYTDIYVKNKYKYCLVILVQYLYCLIRRIFQIKKYAYNSNYVFFQKTILPKLPYNPINVMKKRGIKIIYDVDDAVYMTNNDYSGNIARDADVVICGNEILCRHYNRYNNNCVFVPTIDYNSEYNKLKMNTFSNRTIGWIGTASTIDNLGLIVKPINAIIEKYPDVKFEIICDSAYGYDKKIKNCKLKKWSSKNYIKYLSRLTIGIMPLYNTKSNEGKCGFKLIQYLSMGKPVIASDVGINKEIVGRCGYVVNDSEEWFAAIENLLNSEAIYKRCVKSIDIEFQKKYNHKYVYAKILNAIES